MKYEIRCCCDASKVYGTVELDPALERNAKVALPLLDGRSIILEFDKMNFGIDAAGEARAKKYTKSGDYHVVQGLYSLGMIAIKSMDKPEADILQIVGLVKHETNL